MGSLCTLCLEGLKKSALLTHDPVELAHLLTCTTSSTNLTFLQDPLDGGNACFFCPPCDELIKEMKQIPEQIEQLQIQFGKRICLVRNRILKSQSKPGGDEVAQLREMLLKCLGSAQDDNDLDSGEIEVKIETEDGFEEQLALLDESLSPAEFLQHPDDDGTMLENEEEDGEDGDFEFIINPQKDTSTLRRSKRTKIDYIQGHQKDTEAQPRKKSKHLSLALESSSKKCKTKKIHSTQKKLSHISKTSICTSKQEYEESQPESPSCAKSDPLEFEDVLYNIKTEDGKSLKCGHCAKHFDTEAKLKTHLQQYHSYSCRNCDQAFRLKYQLAAHHRKEHKKIPLTFRIKCAICPKRFQRTQARLLHMVVAHETADKFFTCQRCGKGFTLEQNFKRHMDLHEVEHIKPLVCDLCDSRFPDQARLDQHSTIHNKQCEICSIKFPTSAALLRHRRKHTGEKPYKCQHCEERFLDFLGKMRHIAKSHSTPDQFHPCPVCGRDVHEILLNNHINIHHSKAKSTIPCDQCSKVFKEQSTLRSHKIDKHGADPFICDECGAHLKTLHGLVAHKRGHNYEKPVKCDICDARFRDKRHLAQHMPKHTGERAYPCPHCDHRFKTNGNLSNHIKNIHTQNYVPPNHECVWEGCGKKYHHKFALGAHVRQAHTGEKPFACEVCGKAYAQRSTLNLHRKFHGIPTNSGQRLPRSKRQFPSVRME